MNDPKQSRLSLAALEQFAGPWLMAEDRIAPLLARMRSALPSRQADMDDGDPACPKPPGYSVKNGVARFDINGVLTKYSLGDGWDEWCGLCPTMPLIDALARAMADWMVHAVVFVIDSPGGMVAGTNLLAEAIAAANKIKPCYAIVSDLAASGGYYLASQCRSISCNAMGEVGCIGVYGVLADWSKFYEEFGVKLTVVSSGGVKGLGADGVVSQELIDDQRRGIMGMYEKFIADVATGRGFSIEQSRQLGDGRCWIAPEALKLGLIDTVASEDAAMSAATQETQRMTAEQFKSYAASNPEAAEVKEIVAKGYAAGNKAGIADGRKEYADTLKANVEASKGDTDLAVKATLAGQDAAAIALAVESKEKADAKAKADADAHAAALAAKDAEIARLQFAASGQKPVATTPVAGAVATPAASGKPEDVAKAEWASMSEDDKGRWISETVFIKARVHDLSRAA